ncbi:MAG: hypothetical protein WD070_12055, partial [Pirellulaceae bacterium]
MVFLSSLFKRKFKRASLLVSGMTDLSQNARPPRHENVWRYAVLVKEIMNTQYAERGRRRSFRGAKGHVAAR